MPAVYILASKMYGILYIGFANDLVTRTWQHKSKVVPGFTKQHDIDKLVWYEIHESALAARTREAQIKKWNRAWKVTLIQAMNPTWRDLYLDFTA